MVSGRLGTISRMEVFRFRLQIFDDASEFSVTCLYVVFSLQSSCQFFSSQLSVGTRAIVRSSTVLLLQFCFLVKWFYIGSVLRWFRWYLSVDHNMRVTAQLHPQLSIWSATALCLDICSHVSLVSLTWRQDNGCSHLPPIVWQYRQ